MAFGENWHLVGFQLEGGFDFVATPKILHENITGPRFERLRNVVFNLGNSEKSKCVKYNVEWHREKSRAYIQSRPIKLKSESVM